MSRVLLHCDILQAVCSSRTRNGIPHNDYDRYRRFCSSKVRVLRKACGIVTHKQKYVKFSPPTCTEKREQVMLTLFMAERAFATSVCYRAQAATTDRHLSLWRKRAMDRLTKAVAFAKALVECTGESCDKESLRSAMAYLSYIESVHAYENGHFDDVIRHVNAIKQVSGEVNEECFGISDLLNECRIVDPRVLFSWLCTEVEPHERMANLRLRTLGNTNRPVDSPRNTRSRHAQEASPRDRGVSPVASAGAQMETPAQPTPARLPRKEDQSPLTRSGKTGGKGAKADSPASNSPGSRPPGVPPSSPISDYEDVDMEFHDVEELD